MTANAKDGPAEPDADLDPGATAEPATADGAPEDEAGSEVEAVVAAIPRPSAPKRTGVFVDPDSLRAHVGGLLRTYLGGYEVDALGNYSFAYEGARVFVTVNMSPLGPQVGIFSITNVDVEFTSELGHYLLTTNHQLGFGAFSYDGENSAVWLRHTLLGAMLDGPELQTAIAAVSQAAAHFDGEISDRFGGRAFHDVPDAEQKDTPAPDFPDATVGATGYL